MEIRRFSVFDKMIVEIDRALSAAFSVQKTANRPSPANSIAHTELTENERVHAAGLMRVNHTGEVCAQALYFGQATVSRTDALREHLLRAAGEETDHLAWCAERLEELHSCPSILNPLWYAGSFAIGALAGVVSDRVSLGFVVETERQVEAHLGEHMISLPESDQRSRAIVRKMQEEEAQHGQAAKRSGAIELPPPVPTLMRFAANVMKMVAYKV